MSKKYDPILASFADTEDTAGQIATRQRSIDWYDTLGSTLPNPDPVLKNLGKDISEYTKLLSDPRVQAAVTSRKAGTSSREWDITVDDVVPAQYEIVKGIFATMNVNRVIKEILDSVLFGYKPLEVMWQKQGDLVIPGRVVGKPPDWFRYDDENALRFLTKTDMINGEVVPDRKFLVSSNDASYANPYGTPILAACYWPVKFRHNGYRFWTVFLEKYGMPWITAKAPQGAKQTRINEIATMLENMVQDSIAVVPEDYKIEMLENKHGDTAASYDQYLQATSTEISIAILGTNLTTEVKGGSFAAAKSHMEVRSDIVNSDVRIVEDTMNELIKWIYEINWGPDQVLPKFYMFKSAEVDLEKAERDAILTDKVGVRFTSEYVQRAYDLKEGEDFTMGEPTGSTVDPIDRPVDTTVDPEEVTEPDPVEA